MQPVVWIVVLVVVVLAVLFVLKMLAGIARVVAGVLLLAIVVGGGLWVFSDMNDLRQHFYKDDKLFILNIDGIPSGAFILGEGDEPTNIDDLGRIKAKFPNLAEIKGDYYKVVVLDWEAVKGDINEEGFVASADELREALLSENPKKLFVDNQVETLGERARGQVLLQSDQLYPTQDSFRSTIFAQLAGSAMKEPGDVLKGFKKGDVEVYPETITFKIIKLFPEAIIDWLVPGNGQ